MMANIEFSPDGKHILAGDYPGGVLALWDIASGKRLTTIEAGYGSHATLRYYAVSPDWRTAFAWREKRKNERVEQDGKRMVRWTFGGEVRAWSLEDGKLFRTYKRQPQSNVRVMRLAPDGKTFYTFDELPGTYEGQAKQAVSLWDVKAGTYRTLEGLNSYGVFSADGKILAIPARNGDVYDHALKLIDVRTGREKLSLEIPDKNAWGSVDMFSRDGGLLFGTVRIFERAKHWDRSRCQLIWWNTATGREVASFACEPNASSSFSALSPDGQIAVAFNWQGDKRKLSLFHVPKRQLLRTIVVGEKTEAFQLYASAPVFSPDGKWMVVTTGRYPEKNTDGPLDPRDLPQPRILLIETATGAIRETIIAPQGGGGLPCFSPDGRTLATDGHGRVLLWDMAKMPGSQQ